MKGRPTAIYEASLARIQPHEEYTAGQIGKLIGCGSNTFAKLRIQGKIQARVTCKDKRGCWAFKGEDVLAYVAANWPVLPGAPVVVSKKRKYTKRQKPESVIEFRRDGVWSKIKYFFFGA